MQARGSSSQNQQNQNPNVGATSSVAVTSNSNEVKANLDSVLEISVDKRNVKSTIRGGGKRKRVNPPGGSQADGTTNGATSSVQ